jgi:tetratricopeptide (TPR) repeat protein
MIVCNEQEMLPDCLASVRAVVDEIVVVDTGSSDRSKEIARSAGAVVVDFVWNDDFAAARNASLAHATGDWILVLDADERLAPGAGEIIRQAIDGAQFDCGLLQLHNSARLDATPAEVVGGLARLGERNYLPRLLRHAGGLAYQWRVHENVLSWLVSRGKRVAYVEAAIIHLGALPEVRALRAKATRNSALLEKLCAEHPTEIAAFGYLAHEYVQSGRYEDAKVVIERGWALVTEAQRDQRTAILLLSNARATILQAASDGEGLLATAETAERFEGPHPDFDMMRGVAHELLALAAGHGPVRARQLEAAASAYRAALGKRNTRYMIACVAGATSWAGSTRLGAVLVALGRPAAAKVAFDEALGMQPDYREAKIGRVECLLDLGDPKTALEEVEPLLDERPDGWLLAAGAFEALGHLQHFELFLTRARERRPRGYLSPHRLERHAALHCALMAYHGKPTTGPGDTGALCALLSRRPLPVTEQPPFPVNPRRVKTLLANLVATGNVASVEGWLEPRAEAFLPGLGRVLAAVSKELGFSLADDGEPSYAFCVAHDASTLGTLTSLVASHPSIAPVDDRTGTVTEMVVSAVPAARIRGRVREMCQGRARAVVILGVVRFPLGHLAKVFPSSRFVLVGNDDARREYAGTADAEDPLATHRLLHVEPEDLRERRQATLAGLWAFLGEADLGGCSSLGGEGRIRSVELRTDGTRANHDLGPIG